jgi:4-hydroxy-tetrahydrodipicolinate reductase
MKIGLVGFGKTGQKVWEAVEATPGMECCGIISSKYFNDLSGMGEKPDVIIDFSHPSNLEMILAYTEMNRVPLVLGTTGYSPEQIQAIERMAEKVPVVYTANFSLGITIFRQILKQIVPVLRDTFDMELIEKHHSRKLDAPSGTAKMLLAAMEEGRDYKKVYGRQGMGKRGAEIGVHSVRAGAIAGEHTVLFAGDDEILEITHKAGSNQIFAAGAVLAAQFAAGRKPGLYDMSDVLFCEAEIQL